MAAVRIHLSLAGLQRPIFEDVRRRLQTLEATGPQVLDAMRMGPGGVAEQFRYASELDRAGVATPWPPTRPFGTRPAPRQALVDTGAYRAAWLGGFGSKSGVDGSSFTIGVDRSTFPRVTVFQGRRPTRIRARRRGRGGRLAMQVYLGMTYGVWISESKLLQGLLVAPRRVSVNPRMIRRAQEILVAYLLTGDPKRAAA